MNRKGFASMRTVISIIVIAIAVGAFYWIKYKPFQSEKSSVTVSIADLRANPTKYDGKKVKTEGVLMSGFEAGPALSDSIVTKNGLTALKDPRIYLADPIISNQKDCSSTSTVPPLQICEVQVEGIFETGKFEPYAGSDTYQFRIRGSQQIAPESSGGSSPIGTATIQPVDPNQSGLASYPDLPLTSIPTEPVSVKFVVEHRSALNDKLIKVRGVVVETLLGEKACPPGFGMCAQPRIFLADTAGEDRNKLYDLTVLVNEEEQEKKYPLGGTIEIQGTVHGSTVGVIVRKTD